MKLVRRVLTAFVLFIISSLSVSAVGLLSIAPNPTVDYEPGKEVILPFGVTQSTSDVAVGISERTWARLSRNLIKANETDRTFEMIINMPEDVSELNPGLNSVRVCAKPTKASYSGGSFATVSGACVTSYIKVPYDGKYVVMDFKAKSGSTEESVTFNAIVKNLGKEQVNEARLFIDIWDPLSGETEPSLIETLVTDVKPIPGESEISFQKLLDTENYLPGTYTAKATVTWDGNETKKEKEFRIGALLVKLLDYTSSFEPNKINKLDLNIISEWNRLIEDVYAEINIGDEKISTNKISLQGFQEKTITAYWDTTGFSAGEHSAEITLFFGGKSSKESVTLTVNEIPSFVEQPAQTPDVNLATFLLVVIVMLLIIILAIVLKKKKNLL